MEVEVFDSTEAAVLAAANMIEAFILKQGAVLGLATGETMKPVYAKLARRRKSLQPAMSGLAVYLLDEYIGLTQDDPRSFRNTIVDQFASPLGLPETNFQSPRTSSQDLSQECHRYEANVLSAGVGLQLLGVGVNGHIGFNEPGSAFDSSTRVVDLTRQTRQVNARKFAPDPVPAQAITQGIGTILKAEHLLVLAFGKHKVGPIRRALEEPVSTDIPASAIRLHPKATVLLDPEAASLLSIG